jgi:hypothetical protein
MLSVVQNPPVDNQDDSFIHFLVVSRTRKVTTDGCDG